MNNIELKNHRPYCTLHNKSIYSEKYDAYYCPECDKWLEEKCPSSFCEYCANRPERPNGIHGF